MSLLFRVPESLVNIAHFQKLMDALPAASPAAAPPASPSAATSKESNDEEKQYRTDGSVDDCADHSRTDVDAQLRQ
jgi:ribosomal protein L12E/L44/L45/RPP1/RPP2